MYLKEISVAGFRNLCSQEISPSRNLNLLLGANGQGKTNFLESIYFLSSLKSFRSAKKADMLGVDQEFNLRAQLVSEAPSPINLDFSLYCNANARRLRVNGNAPKNLVDYFKRIKVVCFSPEDLAIISGSPGLRRKFIDRIVFQIKPSHLQTVQEYQKVLKQRNTFLKNALHGDHHAELETWNESMLNQATQLTINRFQALRAVNEILPEQYEKIAGLVSEAGLLAGEISVSRMLQNGSFDLSHGQDEDDLARQIRAQYEADLKKYAALELRKGMTLWGPQREDFPLVYGTQLAARFASMGQRKTLLLALRLAELRMATAAFGELPILLMDDISSELDEKRLKALVQFLSQTATDVRPQIFITTVATTLELLKPLGELQQFQVHNGEIKPS